MIYKRVAGLPWQIIDDKAVIIDPRTQKVHELNEVGSFIWQNLGGDFDTAQISEMLESDFDCGLAVVAHDIEEFCESLVAEGIVECLTANSPF